MSYKKTEAPTNLYLYMMGPRWTKGLVIYDKFEYWVHHPYENETILLICLAFGTR